MKNKLIFTAAAAMLLCTACGTDLRVQSGDSFGVGETTTSSVQTTNAPGLSTTTETTTQPAGSVQGVRKGLWWAVGHSDDWYYEFTSDTEGELVYQSMGYTMHFSYTRTDNKIVFRLGNGDTEQKATITDAGENRFTLNYATGDVQVLTYQEDTKLSNFKFYSTRELVDMLTTQHSAATGKTPLRNETEIDPDGKIVIRFYFTEDKDEEPYTAALDRFTAKGSDSNGKSLDLSGYAKSGN